MLWVRISLGVQLKLSQNRSHSVHMDCLDILNKCYGFGSICIGVNSNEERLEKKVVCKMQPKKAPTLFVYCNPWIMIYLSKP